MPLPVTGPLLLSQIAAEYKKTQRPVLLSSLLGAGPGIPSAGPLKWSDFLGKTMEIRKVVNAGSYQNLNVQTLFTEAERQTNAPKIVTFVSGSVCYSWDINTPALNTGNVGLNTLQLIFNGGSEVQGAGGIGARQGSNWQSWNGTKGGDALVINHPGTTILNNGGIRGGGGGGGTGGQGGQGGYGSFLQWDYTEWRGDGGNRFRQKIQGTLGYKLDVYWDGQLLSSRGLIGEVPWTFDWAGGVLERGNRYGGDSTTNNFQIRNRVLNRYYTTGGRGGQWSGTWSIGGNGQGYGQSRQDGFGGEPGQPGGYYAGRGGDGGRGGNGGTWGAGGNAGAWGASGANGQEQDAGATGGSPGTQPGNPGAAGFSIRSNVGAYTYSGGGALNGPRS